MIQHIRQAFNQAFTDDTYQQYLDDINQRYPNSVGFRIAETPVFFDQKFKNSIIKAGEAICSQLVSEETISQLKDGIPKEFSDAQHTTLPNCLLLDFAITKNKETLDFALIELQAFPSLFAYEMLQDQAIRDHYNIPNQFSAYLNHYTKEQFHNELKSLIVGDSPNNTILLELDPENQKTKIDFYCSRDAFNIPIVNIRDIECKNQKWFCKTENGLKEINRIYNRIVVDEIQNDNELLKIYIAISNDPTIEWFTHPIHFYMYSKFALPFIKHPKVPYTQFLNKINIKQVSLEEIIIKPLYSFSGKGVLLHPTLNDIDQIKDPQHWIYQEKINYANCLDTPSGPTKVELRLFFLKDAESNTYKAAFNLVRLSRQGLINTAHNSNETWVGGSLAYFED
jgi:hypothetical protein